MVHVLPAGRRAADRDRGDRRTGRLRRPGGGAGGAADRLEVVPPAAEARERIEPGPLMAPLSPITAPEAERRAQGAPRSPAGVRG